MLRIIAGLGALLSLFLSGLFILAGIYEVIRGRNAPGLLGGAYFYRRGWWKEPQWGEGKWRWNGLNVVAWGFGLFVISVTLLVLALHGTLQ
jgi:hypothetical protein